MHGKNQGRRCSRDGQGKAKVKIDDKDYIISENESAFVPKGKVHRLENCQDLVLEIIEVQCGSLISEADIVRLEDDFRRDSKK